MDDTRDLWGFGVLQGVLAILFGFAAVFWPELTLVTLVYLFSAFILVWGLTDIVRGLTAIRTRSTWWLTLLLGLGGLGVGVYLVRHPGVTLATFILLAGFFLIVRGVLDVTASFLERETATARTLSLMVGAVSVLAGVALLLYPVGGSVAFVWVLGLYALIAGPLMIALSLDARDNLADVAVKTAARRR